MAKKKVQFKEAKKASSRKAQPRKEAKAVPAKKVKGTPKKAPPKKKAIADKASKKAPRTKAPQNPEVVAQMPESRPVVAEKPATYPNLRRRVGELLDKLSDGELQWLHFEMTDPDAEGRIETHKQAEEARENFPPLNRLVLVQELTAIAVDEFHLADDPDLAERIKDKNSIRRFLTSNK